jgi:uncharacterized membrane protein SirB2
VDGGTVVKADLNQVTAPPIEEPGALHVVRAIGGLLLLLLPGALALRWFFKDALFADALGMVPVLSMGMLTLAGIVVLAIVRSPFSATWAWVTFALTLAASAVMFVRSRTVIR